ncbi:MAG: DUF1376 domain-containing protein [Gemmatimonadales bacterium]|nr:DUF1376 domain-containing protein [Gemmatimonadales bacterium]
MPSHRPYYRCWWKDLQTDEKYRGMTFAERGLYRDLLDLNFSEGSIPADPDKIAAVLRAKPAEVRRLWKAVEPCFKSVRNRASRCSNPRMNREIRWYESLRKAGKKAGKASSRARSQRSGGSRDRGTTVQRSSNDRGTNQNQNQNQNQRYINIGAWPNELDFVRDVLDRGSAPTLAPDLYLDKEGNLDLGFLKRSLTRWAPDPDVVWDEELEKYLDWLSRNEGRHKDRRRGFQNWLDRAKKGWPDEDADGRD